MKLIYIAGKLNADAVGYLKNVHKMCRVADSVKKAGFFVAVPCLDLVMGLIHGNYDYLDYFDNNLEIMKRCDGVMMCDNWHTSEGSKKEMAMAEKLHIPVFFEVGNIKRYFDHYEATQRQNLIVATCGELGVVETEFCKCGRKLMGDTGFLCVDCISKAKGK